MDNGMVRRVVLTKEHRGMDRLLGVVRRAVDVWDAADDAGAIHTAHAWWRNVGLDTTTWTARVELVPAQVSREVAKTAW